MENNVIELKVDGMTCTGCAAGVSGFLEKKGLQNIKVDFASGEVSFSPSETAINIDSIKSGINNMGFRVVEDGDQAPWWTFEKKLLFSALFTIPLILHHILMMLGWSSAWMDNYWLHFALSTPVFIIGLSHFGVSAIKSLRSGVPNMDVLIFIGSSAAYIYSTVGLVTQNPDLIFFETAASIITLVLVGNWLERRSVQQTTTAIEALQDLQVEKAKVVMPSGTMVNMSVDELMPGFVLQINEGDPVPTDGKVIKGDGTVDESMLTGESIPVEKTIGENLVGASVLKSGSLQMEITATGKDTVLSKMIELVKDAQHEKPSIQKLADRISAIFVPAVLLISLVTLLLGYFVFGLSFTQALLNSIAVLVISCPCAMGLATPTAVMVGVGRVARNGILIRGGQTLETFAHIRKFVFDKTGTLTTGEFTIKNVEIKDDVDLLFVKSLLLQAEKHSSHPIAQSIVKALEKERSNFPELNLIEVKEEKGLGVRAKDDQGNTYQIGSHRFFSLDAHVANHSIYIGKNNQLIATVDITDELKSDSKSTLQDLRKLGIKSILLSGDQEGKVAAVAKELSIQEYYAEQQPQEKLKRIQAYSDAVPTAMIGDGINDAAALARATIGVSMSEASGAAIQSAEIVLLNGKLSNLTKAVAISRETLKTIKQNLFWAFAYNIVAIPVAAMGFLNPMWGAAFMAISDVVVIGNSIRLRYKKIN